MKMPAHRLARKSVIFATLSLGTALVACSSHDNSTVLAPGQSDTLAAVAALRGYTDTTVSGTVRFEQLGDSVVAISALSGLQSGKTYVLQVQQAGNCLSPDAGGGAFPAGTTESTADSLAGRLQIPITGVAKASFRTSVVSLNPSDNASIIGRSVVLQETPSAGPILPSDRIWTNLACGIITQGNFPDTSRTVTGTGNGTGTGTGTAGAGTGSGTTGVLPGNG